MRRRLWPAAPFAALALAALVATRSDGKLETIEQVVPGVWFRQGDLDQFGHCNNAVIEMKDYLVVVDANYPSGARSLMTDIKRISPKPVRYVVDTHHHGDHAYGNALWTKAGATSLAYQAVADEMRRVEPARWRSDAARRRDVAELGLDTAEPPKKTFDQTPFVIDDGTRRVELHFFGWAHTRGDTFAYLPKEQVLCTGDAVVNGPYNGFGDGNAANWPDVVRKAMALKPRHVLPAHGPAGGPEILSGQEQYLTEIYGRVKKAIASGKKLEDLVTIANGQPSELKMPLPAAVKNWIGTRTPGQIKDIFEEITQGKPRGAITAR